MKWSIPLAAGCVLALCASCERHDPEVLNKLPGHHAEHAEHVGEAGHAEHPESTASEIEHADAVPTAAGETKTPPKYFNN